MKVYINTSGTATANVTETPKTVAVTTITAPKITQVSEPPTNS